MKEEQGEESKAGLSITSNPKLLWRMQTSILPSTSLMIFCSHLLNLKMLI
jgi:hypothetical protein